MIVCRNDWSMRLARLVMKYTQEIGTVIMLTPIADSNSRTGTTGDSRLRSTIVYTGSNESRLELARSRSPPSGKYSSSPGKRFSANHTSATKSA